MQNLFRQEFRISIFISGLLMVSAVSVMAVAAVPSVAPIAQSAPVRASQDKRPLDISSSDDIRVRIEKINSHALNLSGVGLQFPGLPMELAVKPQRKSSPEMGFRSLRVSWTRGLRGFFNWRVEDRDSNQTLAQISSPFFAIKGMGLRLGLRSAPDYLSIVPVATGGADVIAKLDLETYIRGVLPSEMPAAWPLEALKAQAIAARSFVLFRKASRANLSAPYDVESDVMDQVFKNPLKDETTSQTNANVDRAIRETRGVIMLAANGEPLPAYFHADCGGRTEEARAVWGNGPKTGTAVDGACPLNPLAVWQEKMTSREIAKALEPQGVLAELLSVKALERTHSGRISKLRLAWGNGTETVISGHAFRMAVGFDRIRSTNFKVQKSDDGAWVFSGHGFGHGVGMCQWGAKRLASQGRTDHEILLHYFPHAKFSDGAVSSKRSASPALLANEAID